MSVYCLDPLEDRRWRDFVRTHPKSSVFHTCEWLEALRCTYGYRAVAYSTSQPDGPLENAILFCEVRSWLTGKRLVSVPFADHCEPLVDARVDRDAISAELEHAVQQGRWRSVECRPLSSAFAESDCGSEGDAFCFHTLDLRPSLDELFDGFHRNSMQQTIRRAEREDLRFDAGASEAHLAEFYRLLLLTRRRHRLPPQPIEWFRNLSSSLGAGFRICLARRDGRAIAAVVVLRHADTVVYKYGASEAGAHKLGGIPFLLWNVIREARGSGAHSLDLGRSDLDNPGLMTFKDRLGAPRSHLQYVRYARVSHARAERGWTGQLAKRAIAAVPDRLFISTGRLLYRHFG